MNDARVTLTSAIRLLRLPRWTILVFGGVPLGVAIAVLVRGQFTLPLPAAIVLLAIAVVATVGDEIRPTVPEQVLGLGGIAALVPLIASGADRITLVIAWVLVFRAAAVGSKWASLATLVAALGLTLFAASSEPGLPACSFVLVGMGVAWLSGAAGGQIVRGVSQMREAEELLAEKAARDERRKLAREVHDVIAHSMTVTLLHVTGARLALRDEPEAAEQALQRAERVGRASLEDLRRTVRLLSETSDPTLGTSVDLRDDLQRLRDGFGGEASISMCVEGDADAVPPFVGLTVFRIVQESLTNAIRHASGSCVRVLVVAGDERITMRVENSMGDRAIERNGAGRGLRGMFERAAILGGHLQAGPTKDGWVVAGWVPSESPPGGMAV